VEKKSVKKRNLPKKKTGEKIKREKDPIPWRFCLLTMACGVFLVGGFFVAARSHFASIDFGIKNSSLKKQLEDLEAEKRRLLWLKETALSPAEIKKAAKKLGLTEMTANNLATVPAKTEEKGEKTLAVKTADEKPKQLVEKTVDAKPVEKTGKDGVAKNGATIAKKESREKAPTQIAKSK
jgi:hypothetical protein